MNSGTRPSQQDRADLIVYDLLFPIEKLPRLRERYADDAGVASRRGIMCAHREAPYRKADAF